jgi:hypothetical protein
VNDLLKKIEDDLGIIVPGAREQDVKRAIVSAARSINKFYLLSKEHPQSLIRIAADLKNLLESQVSFNKLNKTALEKFDDSFFRSFEILKKELFTLLERHK